jgi:hypothetical protein
LRSVVPLSHRYCLSIVDIVNPGAERDPHSPIAGMPVLKVWEASKSAQLPRLSEIVSLQQLTCK